MEDSLEDHPKEKQKETLLMNLNFTSKDFIQLFVLVISLTSFYLNTYNSLEKRIVRLEANEEYLRRDIQEVKDDLKEILKELRNRK